MDHIGLLKQLAAAYPSATMTVEAIAVYLRALSTIPVDELQAVVDQAVATHKFLPTIAELKSLRKTMFTMTAAERQRAYCPDSLRGIAIGCDEVYRKRDERRLTMTDRHMLEAA